MTSNDSKAISNEKAFSGDDGFSAENELEVKLIQAQNGEIPGEQFLQEMMNMEVFMPILERHDIGGFQASKEATPLSVKEEDDNEMIILFSSPERAKAFVKEYPGYEGGLLAEFKWVIELVGRGYGVILNPGLEVGLELEADMLGGRN